VGALPASPSSPFVVRVRGLPADAIAATGQDALARTVADAVATALKQAKQQTQQQQRPLGMDTSVECLAPAVPAGVPTVTVSVASTALRASASASASAPAAEAVEALLAKAQAILTSFSVSDKIALKQDSALAMPVVSAAPTATANAAPVPPPPAGLLALLQPPGGAQGIPPPPPGLFGPPTTAADVIPEPPAGLFGPSPVPATGSAAAAAASVTASSARTPGPRLKRLHWQPLDPHANPPAAPATALPAQTPARRSAWTGSSPHRLEADSLPFDSEGFARAFSAQPPRALTTSTVAGAAASVCASADAVFAPFDAALAAAQAPSARRLLTGFDASRSQQLEIVLRATRLPPDALAAAVAAADTEALPYAALECLARHAPTPQEATALRERAAEVDAECERTRARLRALMPTPEAAAAAGGDAALAAHVARLASVEALVSHALAPCDALFLRADAGALLKPSLQVATALHPEAAERSLTVISERLDAVTAASAALTESAHLRTILRVILRFGNFMNADQPAALAFHISTLTKLGMSFLPPSSLYVSYEVATDPLLLFLPLFVLSSFPSRHQVA
jgi:hypothetical protein